MVAGRNSKTDVAVGELCGPVDDADVGHQCNCEPRSNRDPIDRRHDGGIAFDERSNDVASLFHHRHRLWVVADLLGDPLEVTTCGEGISLTGNHHHSNVRVAIEVDEHRCELGVHDLVGCIQFSRVVQRDKHDAIVMIGELETGVTASPLSR